MNVHNQQSQNKCIGSCLFVPDADDSSRVVCLNCKRESSLFVTDTDNSKQESSFNRLKIGDFLSIAVASVLLSLLLNGCTTYEKNTDTPANIMTLRD